MRARAQAESAAWVILMVLLLLSWKKTMGNPCSWLVTSISRVGYTRPPSVRALLAARHTVSAILPRRITSVIASVGNEFARGRHAAIMSWLSEDGNGFRYNTKTLHFSEKRFASKGH